MKAYLTVAALTAVLGLAAAPAAFAQAKSATESLPAKSSAKLTVTTPAFKNGDDIPFENTQYRGNVFPGLSWTKGPKGTQSYAVIMQDTGGVVNGRYILHWTLYDIPASVTKLDPGMTTPPGGSTYGPNQRGMKQAYMGPRTPPGPKHPYHLQVFALDEVIPQDSGMTYDNLIKAMDGHVLATGEVVGMGLADPNAPPPAARPAAPAR